MLLALAQQTSTLSECKDLTREPIKVVLNSAGHGFNSTDAARVDLSPPSSPLQSVTEPEGLASLFTHVASSAIE